MEDLAGVPGTVGGDGADARLGPDHRTRLHDARHTAGTVLLLLGVPDVVVDAIMGWEPGSSARMRAGPLLQNVAQQVGDALWGDTSEADEAEVEGSEGRPSDLN